jgi:hypothetical protein
MHHYPGQTLILGQTNNSHALLSIQKHLDYIAKEFPSSEMGASEDYGPGKTLHVPQFFPVADFYPPIQETVIIILVNDLQK